MSPYQQARQRLGLALARIEAARENWAAAEAELSAAASEVNKFAVNPDYNPDRQKVAAS